ncbi:MAG: hypothetical protein HY917_00235 [Candidatus Diapherotrites archaeon]|nr:hypothetical protein [Candidatus Diapherotrites archaeon]
MKLGIEDFTSADFSGGVSEGPGRGDSPAKKDLRDALSIMEKPSEASYGKELILAINPDTFRKIVKELPRSKRRMITRNMAFIRSNPSIVQEQRRILLARMRFVRRGRNITRGLQAIDFAERQMRKVRLRHENRKG